MLNIENDLSQGFSVVVADDRLFIIGDDGISLY